MWNPVKELKASSKKSRCNHRVPWNPVKELKDYVVNALIHALAFTWNPVKELKGG